MKMSITPTTRIVRAAARLTLLVTACVLTVSLAAQSEPTSGTEPAQRTDEAAGAPAPKAASSDVKAVPAYRKADHVAILSVQGVIDKITLQSLERRVAEAKADGADAVVLEIDTPGGEMTATLDICNLIKTDAPANTVAWINDEAYSAGTIIALACREIVVAPNATFGDAAPIKAVPGFGMMQMSPTERAKIESPLLAEVVDSARRNGYDENLVQAFVSVGMELWMLEHRDTGNRIFVDRNEYQKVFGESPPDEMASVTPPSQPQSASGSTVPRFLRDFMEDESQQDSRASEQPSAEQRKQNIEQQQVRQPTRQPLTAEDAEHWKRVGQVITDDRLLTVKANDAIYYGLAEQVIADEQQLKAYFGAQTISRYDTNWSESLVRFLRHPVVMGILIAVFLIGLFGELAAPGLGVFGAAALAALLLLVGAPALIGMAQWWTLGAILVGLLLIGVELFVIPGIGVTGFLGAIALLTGLVGTFITGDISSISGQAELWTGVITTLSAIVIATIFIWFISRKMGTSVFFDRIVLKGEVTGTSRREDIGDTAPQTLLGAMARPRQSSVQVGEIGTAHTDLRPAGRADINGRLLDVQAIGSFIEKGSSVRVVDVGRYTIDVEEAET